MINKPLMANDAFIEKEANKHSSEKKRKVTMTKNVIRNEHAEIIKKINVKKMLCIGCRHDSEIESFNKNGFNASGIDVATESDLITKMNAHDIKDNFVENEFDVVYSSHSLEHMYDPKLVLEGIKKISKHGVFIVLPIQINGQPSHSHPTIFDVMLNPQSRLRKGDQALEDFSSLGDFEITYYKKTYDEITMYFTWS